MPGETGIIEEILLEHKRRNPANSYAVFDSILWEKAAFCENLTLLLNTCVDGVTMRKGAHRKRHRLSADDGKADDALRTAVCRCNGRRQPGRVGGRGLRRGAGGAVSLR